MKKSVAAFHKKILFIIPAFLIIFLILSFQPFAFKNDTSENYGVLRFSIDRAVAGELNAVSSIAERTAVKKKEYVMALIADAHISEETYEAKRKVIEMLDGWSDIDSVAILGDSCLARGTEKEYQLAKKFFENLKLQKYFITGNHEFYHKDSEHGAVKTAADLSVLRALKLERFKKAFDLPSLYYFRKFGNYLFIFLSVDSLDSKYLTTLSETQLKWFSQVLADNKDMPTVVLCHAPLSGTFTVSAKTKDVNNSVIQPADKIKVIIRQNPQIFMWVAGHKHIKAVSKDYASPLNLYENQVICLHNSSLYDKKAVKNNCWINTLTLSENYVLVKTYDYKNQKWLYDLERKIFIPEKCRTVKLDGKK